MDINIILKTQGINPDLIRKFDYLEDDSNLIILAQIKGEEVRFSLSGSAAATVINDTSDNSAIYVLMPMRI